MAHLFAKPQDTAKQPQFYYASGAKVIAGYTKLLERASVASKAQFTEVGGDV